MSLAINDNDAVDRGVDDGPQPFVAVTQFAGMRGDLFFELPPLRLQDVGRLTLAPRIARREPCDRDEDDQVDDGQGRQNIADTADAAGCNRILDDCAVNERGCDRYPERREDRKNGDRPLT